MGTPRGGCPGIGEGVTPTGVRALPAAQEPALAPIFMVLAAAINAVPPPRRGVGGRPPNWPQNPHSHYGTSSWPFAPTHVVGIEPGHRRGGSPRAAGLPLDLVDQLNLPATTRFTAHPEPDLLPQPRPGPRPNAVAAYDAAAALAPRSCGTRHSSIAQAANPSASGSDLSVLPLQPGPGQAGLPRPTFLLFAKLSAINLQ